MNSVLDSKAKGLPHSATDIDLSSVAARQWNVLAEDLPMPVALLRGAALENNRRSMRRFLARTGAKLAPHGKTHMSPELWRMQIADGAWAITLATVQQLRVARDAGIDRILLANEMIGPRDIAYVLGELQQHPSFDFYCLADSLEGIRHLTAAACATPPGRPLKLLIEMGYQGGRTGCRTLDEALAVARAIKAAEPHLTLCGVEGFEGLFQHHLATEQAAKVRQFLTQIAEVAQHIDREDLFTTNEIILSAGGSAYYDLVMEAFGRVQLSRPTYIVLRSGCYLTHDAGAYQRFFLNVLERSPVARDIDMRFENALEIWAYVLSVPEQGRAILGAGRRDFGHDMGNPVPLKHCRPKESKRPAEISGHEIVAINDQHAHMSFPRDADIRVGDLIGLGVSHPCTTLDKWRLLYVTDESYTVVSALKTYF